MSMNLHASSNGRTIGLRQTPTQISNMICVNDKGEIGELRGTEAQRALWSYCMWLEYLSNGIKWNSHEEFEEFTNEIREEVKYIRKYVKHKNLKVWVS